MSNKIEVHIRINPKKSNKVWKFNENQLSRINKDKEIIYKNFISLLYIENNQKLYAKCLKNKVSKLENLTVFSYGQTGSGKTYTMLGNKDGVIYLCLKDLLDKYELKVSYIEIYNENAFDLFTNKKLQIYNVDKIVINNLSKIKITNTNEGDNFIDICEKNRKYGTTEYNLRSSRSHTIFQIEYASNDKHIVINLIDLAGSEKMCTKDIRRTEGSFINKSLLALCTVVNNLQNKKFFGFRDSKLTRLLQNSLDGKTNIVALCTMSPSCDCIEESISTLNFAARLSNLDLKKVEIPIEKNKLKQECEFEQIEKIEIPIEKNSKKPGYYFEQMKKLEKNFIELKDKFYNNNSYDININKNKVMDFCHMKQNKINFYLNNQMEQNEKRKNKDIKYVQDEITTKTDKTHLELQNKEKYFNDFNIKNKQMFNSNKKNKQNINFINSQNLEIITKSDKLLYELENPTCQKEIEYFENENLKNKNFMYKDKISVNKINNIISNINKNNKIIEKKPFHDNFNKVAVNINHFYNINTKERFFNVKFNNTLIYVNKISNLEIKTKLLEERVENLEIMIQNLLQRNPNKRTNDIFILEKHMFNLKCKKIGR